MTFLSKIFKPKPQEIPAFKVLENSPIKDKYPSRMHLWDWLNKEQIHLYDSNAPRMITMDPWPQEIYLKSNGEMTVKELILDFVSLYGRRQKIPDDLDIIMLDVIRDLSNQKLIQLLHDKSELPYYLEVPKAEQDKEKARFLMIEDGFINE